MHAEWLPSTKFGVDSSSLFHLQCGHTDTKSQTQLITLSHASAMLAWNNYSRKRFSPRRCAQLAYYTTVLYNQHNQCHHSTYITCTGSHCRVLFSFRKYYTACQTSYEQPPWQMEDGILLNHDFDQLKICVADYGQTTHKTCRDNKLMTASDV